MMRGNLAIAVLGVFTAGCTTDGGTMGAPAGGAEARTVLRDPSGREVGQARLQQAAGGVALSVQVGNLPAGTHGVHVHMVGRCDPPDFASAGAHWNPAGRQHGKDNPAGMHMGDLPNIVVAADGRGGLATTLASASLAGVLDADGAALVVHAAGDDYRTDPSGNSGGRIACGVITS